MFNLVVHGVRLSLALVLAPAAWADRAQPWEDIPTASESYQSPLSGYRGFQPQRPGDWRAANDTVAKIGGWQAYAAEVWEANRTPPADSDAERDPESGPHHHHH